MSGTGVPRTAVLVLGMHRSGTSVLTHLIGRLGAALPRELNPAADDNPEGYWESARIVRLNDLMLLAADSSWLDTRPLDLTALGEAVCRDFTTRLLAAITTSFGEAACFVLKDPRLCRMVPFYRALFAAAGIRLKIVIALRAPAEVAASLFQRNQISHDYSAHLWARHVLDAERLTRDLPRIVVAYDELIADWRASATRIRALLDDDVTPADLDHVASPVRPALRHHTDCDATIFAPPMADLLQQLHHAVRTLDLARIDLLSPQIGAATMQRDAALDAEFRFHRLTSPYDMALAPDPLLERLHLAAALARLHRFACP